MKTYVIHRVNSCLMLVKVRNNKLITLTDTSLGDVSFVNNYYSGNQSKVLRGQWYQLGRTQLADVCEAYLYPVLFVQFLNSMFTKQHSLSSCVCRLKPNIMSTCSKWRHLNKLIKSLKRAEPAFSKVSINILYCTKQRCNIHSRQHTVS